MATDRITLTLEDEVLNRLKKVIGKGSVSGYVNRIIRDAVTPISEVTKEELIEEFVSLCIDMSLFKNKLNKFMQYRETQEKKQDVTELLTAKEQIITGLKQVNRYIESRRIK